MKVAASSLRKGAVVDMDGKLYVVLTAAVSYTHLTLPTIYSV